MGCGESKHSVGTTDSFSTRKKSKTGSSSRKVRNSEVPRDNEATDFEDKNISNTTLKNVQSQENGINGSQDGSATKKVENNAFAIDTPIKNNLMLESNKPEEEDDEKKQIRNSYPSTTAKKEIEEQDNKLSSKGEDEDLFANERESKNLSSQHELNGISPAKDEEKEINLVGEGIVTNNTNSEKEENGTNEVTNEVKDQNDSIEIEKTSENVGGDGEANQEITKDIVEKKLEELNEVLENEVEACQDDIDAKQELEEKVTETNPEVGQDVEKKSEINQENIVANPELEQNVVEESKLEVGQEVGNLTEIEQENIDTNPEIEQNDIETKPKVMQEDVEDKSEVEQENIDTNHEIEQNDIETKTEVMQEDIEDKHESGQENIEMNSDTKQRDVEIAPEVVQNEVGNKSESQENNDEKSFEALDENIESTLEAKNEPAETIIAEMGIQNDQNQIEVGQEGVQTNTKDE